LGTVQILDRRFKLQIHINVSVENNSIFGQQTRRLGVNVEHKISDNFLVGATYIKMSERPYTQKSSLQESVNNTIFGLNTNFSTEVPFTRLVNKLLIDTDVPSIFLLEVK
jgi:cell surface protein SprA